MLTVYGVCPSPFVRKVLCCLELKQLAYENIDVLPLHTPADFNQLNPLRKIPVLKDDELVICDSSVICEYLDDQYPDIATRPGTAGARARARWLEEYADTRLLELASGIFYQRLLKPALLKQPADETVIAHNIEKLPEVLDYLEQQLPDIGFLFGDSPMVADIAVASPLLNAEYADYTVDSKEWPTLAGFIQRLKALPLMQNRLEAEAPLIQQLQAT